jgi:3-hydroxybutyryl-CoA dehydratase
MLLPGRYQFEDVKIGDIIDIGSLNVSAQMIKDFANLTGDKFEIHMDTDAAQQHGFSGQVAHGLLVLGLVDGLKNQADAQFQALASLGWSWKFIKPVLAGDQIRATLQIIEKRPTKNPKTGILLLEFSVFNQNNILVQCGSNTLMVYR